MAYLYEVLSWTLLNLESSGTYRPATPYLRPFPGDYELRVRYMHVPG